MNLLKHYIIEVHEVKEIEKEWGNFAEIDATIECCGKLERIDIGFMDMESYERAMAKGYVLL